MKLTITVLAAILSASLGHEFVVTDELVEYVNANAKTWRAHHSPRFANVTRDTIVGMMGTVLRGEPGYLELPIREHLTAATLPTDFDARTAWPQCTSVVGHVRDQSACGSCWAFGATEAFNDRMCIKHGLTTLLSPEDTFTCCTGLKCGFSQGCGGGQPAGAWRWFASEGVVTGGDYDDIGKASTCKPYEFQPCSLDGYLPCPEDEFATPACKSSCSETKYGKTYSADKVKATSSYAVSGAANIQQELYTNGPVTAALTVYEDFMTYTSGVYKHTTGAKLGGHAIKIVGWGVDAGTPYWTILNSWNTIWGEQGAVRIYRGTDECGIESNVVAGDV